MGKKIALGVVGLIVMGVLVVLGLAAGKPDRLVVERSLAIGAPRAVVEPLIVDFARWEGWMPWRRYDPNQRVTLSPVSAGPGATYAWQGNDDVGRGRMEMRSVESTDTATRVTIDMHFLEPWESHAVVVFTIADTSSGSRVTWAMDSEANFGSKVFQVVADMDGMLGADFERGLADIARLATGSAESAGR